MCYYVMISLCVDYIPTDVKCAVINYTKPSQDTNTVIIRISWNIASSIISNVRRYVVECHCEVSGHRTDHKVFRLRRVCVMLLVSIIYDNFSFRIHQLMCLFVSMLLLSKGE